MAHMINLGNVFKKLYLVNVELVCPLWNIDNSRFRFLTSADWSSINLRYLNVV